jgi:protease-4
MRVDGVGTTWLSGALRPDRKLPSQVADSLQLLVEQTYREFLDRVAAARGITPAEVHRIGRGRVWSGADAQRLGLLDRLGGLDEAIASAAARAGLGDGFQVVYIEQEPSLRDQLVGALLSRAPVRLRPEVEWATPRSVRAALERLLQRGSERLARFNDPFGIYAYCPCELD